MKKIFILIVLILISYNGFSQTCDSTSNLKWLIETFEKNDAGFQYVIDKKGEKSYLLHNKIFADKASKISDYDDCLELLNDWTEFFRKNHLSVQLLIESENTTEQTKLSDKEIIKKYSNSEKFEVNKKKFDNYISKLENKTGFEGVWVSEPYTIGIIKDKLNSKREYVGFIVSSESPYWQENQVKLEIFKTNEGKYNMKYYMQDHSVEEIENIEFYGNNYLNADFILLERILPKITTEPDIERYFKSMISKEPFLEKISENTILLRIPSFAVSYKKTIDNLLKINKTQIINTKNLIIDLRYNGGGGDSSYEKIIPYLYTNPIRGIGVAFLSTKLNNERMNVIMKDSDCPEDLKKWAKESLEILNKQIGEFVNLNEEIVSINTLSNIYPNPKNVAILINGRCGSTTEQFLLAANQSKKVKLFGTTTVGSLDISNMYYVNSPSNEFKLWYGLSKSYRIPEMLIDGKGIQPDYYFDKTIKPYEWINKTIEILNYK